MIEQLWYAYIKASKHLNEEQFTCQLTMNHDGSGEMIVRRIFNGQELAPFPNGWTTDEVQGRWDSVSQGIQVLNQLSIKALSKK